MISDVAVELCETMTLKIEKQAQRHGSIIKLIGQIQQDDLAGLKAEVENSNPMITLDLEEVSLVNVEAIRFLGDCETGGVKIQNCSPYIREWISREKRQHRTSGADAGT